MKKILLAAFLMIATPTVLTSFSSCGAMTGTSGNTIQTISKVANVAATAKQIAGLLGVNLGLSNNQQASLTGIFSNYIQGTNGIASLAKTDIGSYSKKLGALNTGTLGKINDVLTVAQYGKLLGLGGKNDSKSSLLSGLKGGKDISSSSINVLSGLLLNGLK